MTLGELLLSLARRSFSEPRVAAAALLDAGVPKEALWPAFLLLNIFVVFLSMIGAEGVSPFGLLGVAIGISLLTIVMTWKVGQALGGHGSFSDTLLVTVFLQALVVAMQMAQLVVALILPGIAAGLWLAIFCFAFWLNVNFITALHGFASRWRGLAVLVIGSFILAVVLSTLLIAVQGPAP